MPTYSEINADKWSHLVSSHVCWTIFLPKNLETQNFKTDHLWLYLELNCLKFFTKNPSSSVGKLSNEGSDFNLEELQGPGQEGFHRTYPPSFHLSKIRVQIWREKNYKDETVKDEIFPWHVYFLHWWEWLFFLHCCLMCSMFGYL